MSYTITSTSTSITLSDPSTVSIGVVKKVENYVFADGTDSQLDRGKSSNYITLSGVILPEWSNETIISQHATGIKSYNTYNDYWGGQRFQHSKDFKITKVKLKLDRDGTPSSATVSIRENLSGSDIISSTFDPLEVSETPWTEYEISFNSSHVFNKSTNCYIVFRTDGTGASNDLDWAYDDAGEGCYTSSDGGDNWVNQSGYSFVYWVYGYEKITGFDKMQILNTMMDNQETVTITGLPDNNLNSDYLIRSLNFNHIPGTINIYRYNITLERLHDSI